MISRIHRHILAHQLVVSALILGGPAIAQAASFVVEDCDTSTWAPQAAPGTVAASQTEVAFGTHFGGVDVTLHRGAGRPRGRPRR